MYKIGELSKLCSIPVKTLRYYDEAGLLKPDRIDVFSGYRYYSAAKLGDCYRIIALKSLGFSLEEIKAQLAADDREKTAALLESKITELNGLIENTEKQLRKIEAILHSLTIGESAIYNIIIRAADGMKVAFVRRKYSSKTEAMSEIRKISAALPKPLVGKRKVIINYETEPREQDIDLAACVEITGILPREYGFETKTISPDGDVASLVCGKDGLEEAYFAMVRHIDLSGHKIRGEFYEIYHDDGTVELKVPVSRADEKQNNSAKPSVSAENNGGNIMTNENYKEITIEEARELFLTHPARLVAQESTKMYYDNFSGEDPDIWVVRPYLSCGCLVVNSGDVWHIHALSNDADIMSAAEIIRTQLDSSPKMILACTMEKIPPELEDSRGSYKFSRSYAPYTDESIRKIKSSDLPQVERCCAPDPEDYYFSRLSAETFLNSVKNYPNEPGYINLGLFEDGDLVGMVESEHLPELGIAGIEIFVKREYRRKGYGKRLLSAICAEIPDVEYCYGAVKTNIASISLAKSCGFVFRGAYVMIQ